MFSTLVRSYTEAFAKGVVPCISTTIQLATKKENERAIRMILEAYETEMSSIPLPTKTELDLLDAHCNAKKVTEASYLKMVTMDIDLKFQAELEVQKYFV